MRILIVDDDHFQRALLEMVVKKTGYEVVTAQDGAIAWKMMEEERFRMVITDWLMEGMDGIELIKRIRAADWPGYTYTLLITAREGRASIIDGLRSGADDYLAKPFDEDELLARIAIGERVLKLEDKLVEQAQRDALTGLFNRRALYDHVRREMHRSARNGLSLGLIMADIDHFKNINDTWGHISGDRVLVHLAGIMREATRAYDHIGRWGGEEFLILLPESDYEKTRIVAERIRSSVEVSPAVAINGQEVHLTVSIGFGSFVPGREVQEIEPMISAVDDALYQAKASGRNQACATRAREN